jgi:hypothetical protein
MAVLKMQPRAQVKSLYDAVIACARRRGYINIAALATERAARYLLSVNDEDEAPYYLEQAITLYHDWGATAKILQLKTEYSFLLSKSLALASGNLSSCGSFNLAKSTKSTSYTGARRHSSTPLRIHHGGSLQNLFSASSSNGKLDTSQSSSLGLLDNSSGRELESCGSENVATPWQASLLFSSIDEVNSGTEGVRWGSIAPYQTPKLWQKRFM